MLGAVTSLRAVDVDDPAAPAADYGLAEPARRAVVVFADGRELVLAFGAEREAAEGRQAGTWLRVGDQPTVWVATTYAVGNIFKTAGGPAARVLSGAGPPPSGPAAPLPIFPR